MSTFRSNSDKCQVNRDIASLEAKLSLESDDGFKLKIKKTSRKFQQNHKQWMRRGERKSRRERRSSGKKYRDETSHKFLVKKHGKEEADSFLEGSLKQKLSAKQLKTIKLLPRYHTKT